MAMDAVTPSGAPPLGPTPPVRVLLVEDNNSDVFLISRMLQEDCEEDFEITNTPRLAEALNMLDRKTFDIVLLDLTLLDMDGVASVAALHAEAPATPIIVHSGMHNATLRSEALMCGAKHYLVKGRESPFSLRFIIQETLRKRPH